MAAKTCCDTYYTSNMYLIIGVCNTKTSLKSNKDKILTNEAHTKL